MVRNIFLPTIFLVLAYGFWISPDFKEISAGVAIFLFGMLSLEEGFKAFTGGLLERMLRLTTDKLWKSLSFGILSTTLMQSSSLVSVITISFLSAGLISLVAGIGIIFGANLGTTTGAWLVAGLGLKVKISAYAMPMIVFGVILVFQKSSKLRGIGYVLTGLGFLFLGIHHMKEGFDAFKDSIDLTAYALEGYWGILVFTLIGMAATVIMQSSHATLVLIITALAAQQITYENALALAIGANLGTTVTAVLGSLSANVDGRRLAGAHLIFNLVTAAISIAFIYQLTGLVDWVSASVGIADDNYTLKLAVFHTIFNSVGIIIMLPWINSLVSFLEHHLKPRVRTAAQPRYLHKSAMELPDTALEAVRRELEHLYDNAIQVMLNSLNINLKDIQSDKDINQLIKTSRGESKGDIEEQYEVMVKQLYGSIISFISDVRPTMDTQLSHELFTLRTAGREIVDALKDTKHLQKNLIRYAASDTPELVNEYDGLKRQLIQTIRELEGIRNEGVDAPTIIALDELKLNTEQQDIILNSKVENLIREHCISADQATSLMKDGSYTRDIIKNLISVGSALFLNEDIDIRNVERTLGIGENM